MDSIPSSAITPRLIPCFGVCFGRAVQILVCPEDGIIPQTKVKSGIDIHYLAPDSLWLLRPCVVGVALPAEEFLLSGGLLSPLKVSASCKELPLLVPAPVWIVAGAVVVSAILASSSVEVILLRASLVLALACAAPKLGKDYPSAIAFLGSAWAR